MRMFGTFIISKIDDECNDRPFMLACKDREYTNGERWVTSSLSIEEAKQLYEYLGFMLS